MRIHKRQLYNALKYVQILPSDSTELELILRTPTKLERDLVCAVYRAWWFWELLT